MPVVTFLRHHRLCAPKGFLWFTVGWKTWRCWKQPSPVLRVSSETASLLCKRPRTDASAPPSMLGGATTGFKMPTLIMHGTYVLKTWKHCIRLFLVCRNPWLSRWLNLPENQSCFKWRRQIKNPKSRMIYFVFTGNVWKRQLLRSLLDPMIAECTHQVCRKHFMIHRFWSWTEFLR